jgi:hypothetical protein
MALGGIIAVSEYSEFCWERKTFIGKLVSDEFI